MIQELHLKGLLGIHTRGYRSYGWRYIYKVTGVTDAGDTDTVWGYTYGVTVNTSAGLQLLQNRLVTGDTRK